MADSESYRAIADSNLAILDDAIARRDVLDVKGATLICQDMLRRVYGPVREGDLAPEVRFELADKLAKAAARGVAWQAEHNKHLIID